MNHKSIRYILGMVCIFEGLFLLLPMICALCYSEFQDAAIFVLVMCICFITGILLCGKTHGSFSLQPREGMAAVGLSWIILSLLGVLPFFLSGQIPSFIDAFFETVSGFTTTGSSILNDVETLGYGMRFWRSFTHWIGGMGVLVFLLAILPSSGTFMNLMRAESPGPSVSKLVPKVKETAKTLYLIYFGMTLIQIILLLAAGMDLFDTLTLTMGTAGTGGFSVRSDGFASYSWIQVTIIAVFMMLFGINFNFYFLLLKRKFREAFRMEEVITYIVIIATVTIAICFSVQALFPNWMQNLHNVFFTVSSLITTTGYATVDFNAWTPFARILLVLIMFIGACAGSTGGGIKVSRLNIMFKGIKKEITTQIHPNAVKKVRMDGKPVAHEVVRSVNVFLAIYILIFTVSLILISLDGKELTDNFTAVAATLNNIGPGLGEVGPTGSFAGFSDFSKLVLSFDMLAGRLEILPLILLFIPAMWKQPRRRCSYFRRSESKNETAEEALN